MIPPTCTYAVFAEQVKADHDLVVRQAAEIRELRDALVMERARNAQLEQQVAALLSRVIALEAALAQRSA